MLDFTEMVWRPCTSQNRECKVLPHGLLQETCTPVPTIMEGEKKFVEDYIIFVDIFRSGHLPCACNESFSKFSNCHSTRLPNFASFPLKVPSAETPREMAW